MQLALDQDPDAWIRELFEDLLVPSEAVEPDSPQQRAEIAARIDEHDAVMAARRERELARPGYVPKPVNAWPLPPTDWWVRLQKRLGNL